jgi:hypothetical protein
MHHGLNAGESRGVELLARRVPGHVAGAEDGRATHQTRHGVTAALEPRHERGADESRATGDGDGE